MSWVWLPSAQKETKRPGGQVRDSGYHVFPRSRCLAPLTQAAGGTESPPLLPSQEPVCLALPAQARKCPVGCFLYTFREHKHWGQASLCRIGQVALPLWASLFSPGRADSSLTGNLVDLDGGSCVCDSQPGTCPRQFLAIQWLPLCPPVLGESTHPS